MEAVCGVLKALDDLVSFGKRGREEQLLLNAKPYWTDNLKQTLVGPFIVQNSDLNGSPKAI